MIPSVLNEEMFPSEHSIGEKIIFVPMARQLEEYGIEREISIGKIVAIRFTEAKVLHDIVDDYFGYIFKDVDSFYVRKFGKIGDGTWNDFEKELKEMNIL